MSVSDCKQVYLDDQMEDDCELGGNRWQGYNYSDYASLGGWLHNDNEFHQSIAADKNALMF